MFKCLNLYLKNNYLNLIQVKKNGVACWNSKMPLKPEHTALIANNAETLEFPNDLKVTY